MITVPAGFRAMPRWWHDEPGRVWLDELPALVDAQCRRWALVPDGEARHGSNALVVPVRREDEQLVLRLSPPGDDVEQESRALRFWDGRGTVQLVEADIAHRSLLLERLDDTRSLQHEPLATAVSVLGDLTRVLAVPAPPDVPSTAAIARDHVTEFPASWRALGGPTPTGQLERSVAAATDLATASDDAQVSAVDGDLHFEQVLAARRAPWLVVDPVLLRGDREYDLGRVLWSRLDELPTDQDVTDAFDRFVDAADVPRERARAWVIVRSMSYLLWGLERGLTWDPPRCRRLLGLFC